MTPRPSPPSGGIPEERAVLGERQHGAWETIQRSHAIANGCFVMAANRTGFEPDPAGSDGIRFWGQSFIAGTDGRILARAGVDEETVVVADLDLSEIAQSRIGWPFLRDPAHRCLRRDPVALHRSRVTG